MKPFSWDQKIQRAKKLAGEVPSAAQILALYAQVAAFQKEVAGQLEHSDHSDIHAVLRFIPQLRALAETTGSPALQNALAELGENEEKWTELLLRNWEHDGEAAQPSAHVFLAFLLTQPYAQHVTSRMSPVDSMTPDCQACGNPPHLSVLRELNNGAKRSLLCGLCGHEWEFRRTQCPTCGEQNKDKLPVFTAEQINQARIEACDSCKTYIKCVDLTKDGYAVPQVDDLATVALDFWAQEQGYSPCHPNIFLLPEN